MAGDQRWQAIPTQLELAEFEQFILPHLSPGARGPAPKLSLHKIFNYVLKHVYLGCQWKELPIDKDGEGRLETAESARGVSPRAAHRSGLDTLASSGSCHRTKAAAFRQELELLLSPVGSLPTSVT